MKAILGLIWLALILAGAIGWVLNLIAVIHAATADAPFTTLVLIRIIGVPIFILGAVLGWF